MDSEKIVIDALRKIHAELGINQDITPTTLIYGGDVGINSLSLVKLIVEIEESVMTNYRKAIVLADDRSLSLKNSPFNSVETLTNYLNTILCESN